MPRVANCSSISSSAPGWSSGSSAMSEVLSAPVGGGGATVRATSTNRVTAFGLSPIFSASRSSSWCSRIPGGEIAASASLVPSSSPTALATLLDAGMCACAGSVRAQPLQALRVGDGVGRDERDVLEPRAGPRDEHEVHRHEVLAHDPQAGHGREGVLRGGDTAVDRVLDRDHGGIRTALDDVGERLADVAHRVPLVAARLGHLSQRRLGECAGRTEIAVRAADRRLLGVRAHTRQPIRVPDSVRPNRSSANGPALPRTRPRPLDRRTES